MNPAVFYDISYGLYVVSSMDEDRPVGCVANAVTQITAFPDTIAVSINHDNYTNSCIEKSGMFAFSILAEDADPALIGKFGFRSSRDTDKFTGEDFEVRTGMPVLKKSRGFLVCKVINKMETETHTVFLGEVVDGDTFPCDAPPITYSYYHKVVKGKSPKNAPTYRQEETAKTNPEPAVPSANAGTEQKEEKKIFRFVCPVCGYVHEAEELPEGFTCPICGVDGSQFQREE